MVTAFTAELGKVTFVAKGLRRINSRRAPHLELFNLVNLVVSNSSRWRIITDATIINAYDETKKDLKRAGYLFYVSEVLDKILPEDQAHPKLFELLEDFLGQDLTERNVKNFIVELLWNLGYLPPGQYPKLGVTDFVESIVEKRIRSKRFLEEI